MKRVLVKKALPRHWSKDFDTTEDLRNVLRQARLMSLEDAKNIENIPLRPDVRDWELSHTAQGMKSIIPGIQGGKITDQGYVDEGGAFTYPPQLQSFLPMINPDARMSVTMPDIPGSMGKPSGRPSVLVGSFEKPEFHATQKEGRVQTEGFMPGGFDPSQAVLLTEPSRAFARQEVPMAIQNLVGGKMKDYAPGTFGYDEPVGRAMESFNILPYSTENPLSQFSGWGQPRTVDDEFRLSEPMDIAFQLLKDDNMEEYMEDAFDLGSPLLSYDELHGKQKQIVDTIAGAPSSYWNDPESGELETENYSGMFQQDEHHLYPDEAFDEYLRYIQHFHDASAKISAMPHEEQMKIMSHYSNQHMLPNEEKEEHPLHPAKVALDKMAEEYEHWNVEDPHGDFYNRYNEPKSSQGGASRMAGGFHRSEPMDIAMRLLKRDKIYDPNAENKGQEGVDWHPGEEGVDWDSAVSSLHPSHDLTQRHPFDYDMHEYDHHAQKLLNLMRNRDVAHLQNNENPMTEDEQFDLMDAQQKLQASIPKNTHFPSIQNAVGYDKDGNKISTFGDGRPKFNEGSPRYQELIGDRPTVPIHTEGSFYGVPFNEETGFTRSEPMDIAMRLLKNEPADYADTYQQVRNNIGADGEYMTDEELNAIDERYSELHDDEKHLEEYYNLLEAIELEKKRRAEGSFDGIGHNEETGFTRSEPMNIAFQLLKERVSPEAKRHKLEYDKKYESSPERVKYREELNRERRRRGIYGSHDHKDISHTKGGKLTLEGEHENRARHFKDKGTLREL